MCYESPTKNLLGSNKCILRVLLHIYETPKKLIQAILCRKGELLSRGPLSLNHSRSEIASEKHPSLIVYRRFLFISFFRWFPPIGLIAFCLLCNRCRRNWNCCYAKSSHMISNHLIHFTLWLIRRKSKRRRKYFN